MVPAPVSSEAAGFGFAGKLLYTLSGELLVVDAVTDFLLSKPVWELADMSDDPEKDVFAEVGLVQVSAGKFFFSPGFAAS